MNCEAIALIANATLVLIGIENDTHYASGTHPSKHGYRKRYPTHKKNTPTQARVSKTIPITQVERTHASTGIENDTQHTRRMHPRKHGYRKRYPTRKKNAPTQTQVSKTIPGSREYKEYREFNEIRENSISLNSLNSLISLIKS